MVTTVEFDHATATSTEFMAWADELKDATAPVYNTVHGGFWVASRYEDVAAIINDNDNFVSGNGVTIPWLGQPAPLLPVESDEPDHRHYRNVLAPFMTPRAVRANEAVTREIVSETIDEFIELGEVDVVSTFATPVPVFSMARLFGLSRTEARKFG